MSNQFSIGQVVLLNGKEYTITGTCKKSFVLERDGKQYKATADRMKKIQHINEVKKAMDDSVFPHLERRIKYRSMFIKNAPPLKMPTNFDECKEWFAQLTTELSPENLSCDGELSSWSIIQKKREIMSTWKELEQISGRRVSEFEIESGIIKEFLSKRELV